MRNVCRSLRAIPTPDDLRTSGRAFPDDHSHAGFPQGFLTRRILTFVSFYVWLTNAINRIVKEQVVDPSDTPDPSRRFRPIFQEPDLSHELPPMASAGAGLLMSNPPRPSQSIVIGVTRVIITNPRPRSNPLCLFSKKRPEKPWIAASSEGRRPVELPTEVAGEERLQEKNAAASS
jgi:hypothetical protein